MNLIWFRNDLRTKDLQALKEAAETKKPTVALYILDDQPSKWPMGGATKWWLHHSLVDLGKNLSKLNVPLILRRGDYLKEIEKFVKEASIEEVFFGRLYTQSETERDKIIVEYFKANNIKYHPFNHSLLCDPWTIKNKSGEPYKVYTPFWRTLSEAVKVELDDCVHLYPKFKHTFNSLSMEDLKLLPTIPWDKQFYEFWTPGEEHALARLEKFIEDIHNTYSDTRNIPSVDGTSLLSPHLHFGEISPMRIWHEVKKRTSKKDVSQFLKEIVWREFAYHLLYHFPKTDVNPLRPEFENFPWKTNNQYLKLWQKGQTGYPIVDAGMRQLWKTGWMHNRVRMIVASFLVKHLLIPWQSGSEWFWDTLVDADLASNTLGWQWTAGCGADAAPYFRIFNPITQGEKFDPDGKYIRQWVPELTGLENKWIHKPFEAPEETLKKAKICLGDNYPKPVVNHFEARMKALLAYEKIKKNKT